MLSRHFLSTERFGGGLCHLPLPKIHACRASFCQPWQKLHVFGRAGGQTQQLMGLPNRKRGGKRALAAAWGARPTQNLPAPYPLRDWRQWPEKVAGERFVMAICYSERLRSENIAERRHQVLVRGMQQAEQSAKGSASLSSLINAGGTATPNIYISQWSSPTVAPAASYLRKQR